MANNELLTKEQRRGLIYGSLISAGLAAGAALRSGGDIRDAIGAGTLGLASGYGGGINEVLNTKKKMLDQARESEIMKASEEARKLTGEKFQFEKERHILDMLMRGAPSAKEQREAKEAGEEREALMSYLGQQRARHTAPGITGFQKPFLSENEIEMLMASPRSDVGNMLREIMKAREPKYEPKPWQTGEDQWGWIRPGEDIPKGAKPMGEVMQRPLVIPLGQEVEVRTPGKPTERLPVTPSPNVLEQEKGKRAREEAKTPAAPKYEEWLNLDTLQTERVEVGSARAKELAAQKTQQGSPLWREFEAAIKLDPYLKHKLAIKNAKEKAAKEKAVNPTLPRF